jgi:hypothetical protein
MMDYHRQLVRRSDSDNYPPTHSYEPAVILSSPTVRISPTVLNILAVIKVLVIGKSVVVTPVDDSDIFTEVLRNA